MLQNTPANTHPAAMEATKSTPARIAVIRARWHADIVDNASQSFIKALDGVGLPDSVVSCHDVPGAFEIPLLCQQLARSGTVDAIVACAFVVDGGIYRHDFVASSVIDGLMRVQLDESIPVFSVVLTPHHFQPTEEHIDFFKAHFVTKGKEAAVAVAGTLTGSPARAAARSGPRLT